MQEKEGYLTEKRQKELSTRELEERLYLDLGFTSFDDYYRYLKKLTPLPSSREQVSKSAEPSSSSSPSSWSVMGVIDNTRETLDGWLKDGTEAVIEFLLKVVPKGSTISYFIHFMKGAAPHLVPFIWLILGYWGALILLVLNFPVLKDKVWPQLVQAWKSFYLEVEKKGLEVALLNLKNSLFHLTNQVIAHYKDRFQKAETTEEQVEILGELVAFGIITIEGAGAVKGVAQITVKGGKALAKVPGKIPSQMTALQEHLSQQLSELSKKLGPAKTAELLEKVKKRAAALGKNSGKNEVVFSESEAQVLKSLEREGIVGTKTGGASAGHTAVGHDTAAAAVAREAELPQGVKQAEKPKVVDPQKTEVPVVEKTPSELAQAWQGSGSYPGVDRYKNITLKEGTYILGGSPGQSEYHFPVKALRRTGYDSQKIFEGLQVKPWKGTYRRGLTLYRVKTDTPAAFALTLENPQYGNGGLPQIFIPKYKEVLEPVHCYILDNFQAREEILIRMSELGIN